MNLASLVSGGFESWNLPLVLLLIKATTILLAALGITMAMQRASAGARHLVWLVTLGALLLVPALTAWAPLRLEILPARAEVPAVPSTPSVPATPSVVVSSASGVVAASAPAPAPTTAARSTVEAGILTRIANASLWSVALALWGAVALVILLSLAWSTLVVRRLVRHSEPLDDQSWLTPLYEVSDRLGLDQPPQLLMSREAKMPFACGVATPTIVLPAECEQWSQERRLAVLLHELAHVRRRDLLGHTLGRLVCAFYWFHPLVWTAARQLRAESERACDDLALSCGTRATDYAEHLLDIVTSVRREATPVVALAMARRKEFEGRMLAILDPELRHSTPSRAQSAMLIGALAFISLVVGAATPAPASARPSAAPQVAQQDTTRHDAVAASSHDPSIDENANADNDRAMTRTLERTSRFDRKIDKQVEKTVARSVDKQMNRNLDGVGERVATVINDALPAVVSRVVPKAVDGAANATTAALENWIRKGAQDGKRSDDDRPALLARVLRSDTSASLRKVAAWGLSEYADEQVATEALANAVRRDASETVREMAAWSLAESNRSSAAVEALGAALRDGSTRVRRTAAWALGNVGDSRATDALVSALGDADAAVRTAAVWAIGNVEPKQAPRQLVALLSDKDPQVRELTAWALYTIEDPATAPALQNALRTEQDKDLQLAYIRALAAMGEKSVDAIRPLLESSDARVKSMAVRALAGGHATGPWPHPWPMPRPYP